MSLTESKDMMLPLMEAFYTVQGEGVQTGRAAYFIRLGGCDVGCEWCDVKESWLASRHAEVSVASIVEGVVESGAKFVVITGGEPLIHDLGALTRALHAVGCEIAIESSGSHPMSGEIDWVCISPKRKKMPLKEAYEAASELKVVVGKVEDFAWAEGCAAEVRDECRLYLQPEWSVTNEIMSLIVEYVKSNPRWRVSLQTHKYMDIP